MKRRHYALVGVALIGFLLIGVVDREQAGQVLYCILTASAFAFAFLYRNGSNWRVTEAGRALMSLVIMFALFSAFVSTSYWLRGANVDGVKDWVRAILLLVLTLTFVNLTLALRAIQKHRSERDAIDAKICPIAEAEANAAARDKLDPIDTD